MKNFTVYIFIVGFLISCSKEKVLTKPEYIKWVENSANNLKKRKVVNNIVYELQYKPVEYAALMEFDPTNFNQALFEKRKKELDGYTFFNMRLAIEGKQIDPLMFAINDQQEYSIRDMFYSYEFKNNIKQVINQNNQRDTLGCSLYHFVQYHGMAPYVDFVFMFDTKGKSKGDFEICFKDPAFNNGYIKFNFSEADILNIPKLETQNESK